MKIAILGLAPIMLSAAALASSPDEAQNAQAAKAGTSSEHVDGAKDPNKRVCKKEKVTGSRLAIKTTCMTQAQWDQQKADNRMQLEKDQSMNWHGNGG